MRQAGGRLTGGIAIENVVCKDGTFLLVEHGKEIVSESKRKRL